MESIGKIKILNGRRYNKQKSLSGLNGLYREFIFSIIQLIIKKELVMLTQKYSSTILRNFFLICIFLIGIIVTVGSGGGGSGGSDPPSNFSIVGTWGLTSIGDSPPGFFNASNSVWEFYENGTYEWFLDYEEYNYEGDGNYSLADNTLTVDGIVADIILGEISNKTVVLTISNNNNTFSFLDDEGDRWTYNIEPYARITGTLTLPEEAIAKEYFVLIDDNTDHDDDQYHYTTGICGSGTKVTYSLGRVPAGTYFMVAGVRIESDSDSEPEVGDYLGYYGGSGIMPPEEANVIVPSSGSVTFDIPLHIVADEECEDARFTDMGNGTVRDIDSGLIWLKDANCSELEGTDASGKADWVTANSAADSLSNGTCGLIDGTSAGDWRLPTHDEWWSFVDSINYSDPVLCNAAGTAQWSEGDPFTGVQSDSYWSSTTYADDNGRAWYMDMNVGFSGILYKSSISSVWPVRSDN